MKPIRVSTATHSAVSSTSISRRCPEPLDPKVREFVHYALSAEGQWNVVDEGSYPRRTAEVVREEPGKLTYSPIRRRRF
jgi:hypothetical protein